MEAANIITDVNGYKVDKHGKIYFSLSPADVTRVVNRHLPDMRGELNLVEEVHIVLLLPPPENGLYIVKTGWRVAAAAADGEENFQARLRFSNTIGALVTKHANNNV